MHIGEGRGLEVVVCILRRIEGGSACIWGEGGWRRGLYTYSFKQVKSNIISVH